MEKHIWMVYGRPLNNEDEEFVKWYKEMHMKDLLTVPGFVSAQMFKLVPVLPDPPVNTYLLLYEVEGPLQPVLDTLMKAKEEANIYITPVYDMDAKREAVYEQLTEKLTIDDFK